MAFDPDPRPTTKKRPKKKRKSFPPPPPPAPRGSIEAPGSSSRVSNPTGLRQYAFIRANAGVNWRGLDPALLQKLNVVGRATGKVITLTSGFRTHAEQRRLYEQYLRGEIGLAAPPGQSNHESGDAVDALVDGQPIASVIDESTLNSVGLRSLAHLDDPVHVELSDGGASRSAAPVGPAAQQPMAPSGGYAVSPVEAPQYTAPGNAAMPTPTAEVLPFELEEAPQDDLLSVQQRAETWQLIAQQPGASPEAQALARIARISAGR